MNEATAIQESVDYYTNAIHLYRLPSRKWGSLFCWLYVHELDMKMQANSVDFYYGGRLWTADEIEEKKIQLRLRTIEKA